MKHLPNGGCEVWIKAREAPVITRNVFESDGALGFSARYRMDERNRALSCTVLDGEMGERYKVSFGYRKSTGEMVEERVYGADVNQADSADKRRLPLARVIHRAHGNSGSPEPVVVDAVHPEAPVGRLIGIPAYVWNRLLNPEF